MTYGGFVKVWDGSAWQWRTAKVWSGTVWEDRPVYWRNASAFQPAWNGTSGAVLPDPYPFRINNWHTGSIGQGTIITNTGFNNSEGTWYQLVAGASVTQNIYDINMWLHSGSAAGNARQMLMDIGIDTAGGTSYTPIISNLAMGATNGSSNSGRRFRFPYYIPSGSSVAVRVQGADAAGGGVRCVWQMVGGPAPIPGIPYGTYNQTFGTITNSSGTSFTMGATGSDGAWVSLGTASNPLWYYQIGLQCDNTNQAGGVYYVDLGVGSSGSQVVINRIVFANNGSEAWQEYTENNVIALYYPITTGQELWIRGRSNQASPDTGWNATVVGIGG